MQNLKFLTKKSTLLKQIGWVDVIVAATKEEENLLQKNADELTNLMDNERGIVVVNESKEIVGFMALWLLGVDKRGVEWNEVGTVYVPEQHRNQGVCQQMLEYAFSVWHQHMIISTSKNEKFIHASLKSMVPVSADDDVENAVPLTCVCTEEDGVRDANICPYRDAECVFLLSHSTAQKVSHKKREDMIVTQIMKVF